MLTTTETYDAEVVAVVIHASSGAGAGPLNGTKMGLFTNQPALTKTMVLTDFVQPLYSSYALQTLTWAAAARDAGGNIGTDSSLTSWTMSDALNPATCYGYFITDSTGMTVQAAEYFPNGPLGLVDTLSFIGVVSRWCPANPNASVCTIVD